MRTRFCLYLLLGASLFIGPHAAQAQQNTAPPPNTPATSLDLTRPADQITAKQVEGMRRQLLDWPNLGRYRKENAALGEPKAGENRVVFLGDSITDFWKRRGKFFPGKPYVDRGISGQTTPQMVLRFQQDVIALHPKVVVILAGINDIAGNTGPAASETIEDNFRTMVTLAESNHIRVVLSSILPASVFPWNPGVDPRPRVEEINSWLKRFAAEHQLGYIDYFSAMADSTGAMHPELAEDKFVHPNAAGYAVMEPLAEAAIEAALKH